MANLKDIRIRINSVRTTRQVTSAMKMVSAAKLKKAQDDVGYIRPFVEKLQHIISFLADSAGMDESFVEFREWKTGKILIVPIASNKGLAGAFNSNVTKEVERMLRQEYKQEASRGNVDIIPIGKQLSKAFASRKIATVADYNDLLDAPTTEKIYEIAATLLDKYKSKTYKRIILVYNQFVNAAVQRIETKQLLPLVFPKEESAESQYYDFIIEPNKKEVLESLIPETVKTIFYATIIESTASEHGARMTSMHKATDNATSLLGELQLQYNKARQSAITGELIEIVSGAEALNK